MEPEELTSQCHSPNCNTLFTTLNIHQETPQRQPTSLNQGSRKGSSVKFQVGNSNSNSNTTSITRRLSSSSLQNQELWSLPQSDLISLLLQSQNQISHLHKTLEKRISESIPLGEQRQGVNDSTNNVVGPIKKSSSIPLVHSPLVNTPPYEYIVLTKENEKKCRIYVNPKVDEIFKDELGKVGIKVEEEEQLSILPQPHASSDATIIHCFDPSEVDVELKKIFKDNPPSVDSHKIIRKKSRADRGSSVPAIDSYYGTKDLEKVGHASYFIPELTESERKAIGWKDKYTFGKWKYSNPSLSRIKKNPQFSKSFKNLISKCGKKSKEAHITTCAAEAFKISEESAKDTLDFLLNQAELQIQPDSNCKCKVGFGDSKQSPPSILALPQKKKKWRRKVFKHFIKWIVPCYKNSKGEKLLQISGSKYTSPDDLGVVSVGDEMEEEELRTATCRSHDKSGPKPNSHSHSQKKDKSDVHLLDKLLGFFHIHQGENGMDEVLGGDVLLSTDDSSASLGIHDNALPKPQGQQDNKNPEILQAQIPRQEEDLNNHSFQMQTEAASTVAAGPKTASHITQNEEEEENASENAANFCFYTDPQTPSINSTKTVFSFYNTNDYNGVSGYEDDFGEEEDEDEYKEQSHYTPNIPPGIKEEFWDIFETVPESRFLDPKDECSHKSQKSTPTDSLEEYFQQLGYNEEYYEGEEEDYEDFELEEYDSASNNNNNKYGEEDIEECETGTTVSINLSTNGKVKNKQSSTGEKATINIKNEDCKVV